MGELYIGFNINKLLARMKERGMTDWDLCRKANVQQPNFSRIKNGKNIPTLLTTKKLAFAVDLKAVDLIEENTILPAA